MLLVTLGWVTIDSTTIDTIVSVAGVVLSVVLTLFVRSRATPVTAQRPGLPTV